MYLHMYIYVHMLNMPANSFFTHLTWLRHRSDYILRIGMDVTNLRHLKTAQNFVFHHGGNKPGTEGMCRFFKILLQKMAFLTQNKAKLWFWEKRQFFHRNLAKIVENCDHNIEPGSLRLPGRGFLEISRVDRPLLGCANLKKKSWFESGKKNETSFSAVGKLQREIKMAKLNLVNISF
jgi:hypothetical protein